MNNQRKQPIYDNKNVINAGKYDFEKVNSINKGNGEMSFDSTITYKEKESKNIKPIIVTSIISGVLLIFAFVFAFTDLKYVFFPKDKQETVETDFEDTNIMHELVCTMDEISKSLTMSTKKTFIYNNNKIKKTIYEYKIDVLDETLSNDQEFIDYMEKTYNIVDVYKGIDGLDLVYTHENNSKFYFKQEIDLKKLSRHVDYMNLTDVYLDQSINITKSRVERKNFVCEIVEK